ncbi:hypothetical protein BCR32DRAFT_234193 [Anaeromyces robustus]|uniref:CBM10 domain-containing protein n=1 Tax=Anaeromyces robustus TaxID=1754192 RepID=A0A1Y1X218_9FUNG|nr:hypothetical protein BCR32DRAFT_234193 [Anaeromyces robustus]|eukprot:ORX79374.1 hypothetical protein BCR32DRAFT_234193 [Anaeromyces robustus]
MSDADYKKVLQCVQVSIMDTLSGKTKDHEAPADITISDDENTYVFTNSTFKTGGNFARTFSKPGFNIKLSKKFYDRKSFRLRADVNDRSHLRQKIVCDISNRIGLPSTQSTYVRLTINENLYGVYTLMDSVKPANIKQIYNVKTDKEDLKLYKCDINGFDMSSKTANHCLNETGEDEKEISEFKEFMKQVDNAKTVDDLDKFMNVDIFLKSIALEWIIGSFDHLLVMGHNIYFYKNEINNKWDIFYYDFDNTLGVSLNENLWFSTGKNKGVKDFSKLSFKQFTNDQKIFDIAVNNDSTRFKKNLKEILTYGFNPVLLNPHIDDIKSYISPYVKEEFIPINGELPGRVNKIGMPYTSSYEIYEKSSEYETIYSKDDGPTPGVKGWIKSSFENACERYGLNQEQILKDAVTLKPTSFFTKIKNNISPYESNEEPVEYKKCWAEKLGYSCCQGCHVIYVDNDGEWGVENNAWCGINQC